MRLATARGVMTATRASWHQIHSWAALLLTIVVMACSGGDSSVARGTLANGEPCSVDSQCLSGHSERPHDIRECVAKQGESCGDGVFCSYESNLYCDIFSGPDWRCELGRSQGAECSSTIQCGHTPTVLICTRGSAGGHCQPGIKIGEPCDPSADACFLSGHCDAAARRCVCDMPEICG